MSSTPVTVLMTVWNGEAHIDAAVRSILDQSFRDFTFLILDNASTDRTVEKIRQHRDPRIRLVCLPENLGQTGALNHGLSLVESKFVARMDADDVSHPDRLLKQCKLMEDSDRIGVVGCDYNRIDAEGSEIDRQTVCRSDIGLRFRHLFGNGLTGATVMFRHDLVWGKLGGFNGEYAIAQDYELVLRILKSHEARAVGDYLFSMRLHGGNTSKLQKKKCAEDTRKVLRRNAPELLGLELTDTTRAWVDALFPPVKNPRHRYRGIGLMTKAFFQHYPEALQNDEVKRELADVYGSLLEPWCNPDDLSLAWRAFLKCRQFGKKTEANRMFSLYLSHFKKTHPDYSWVNPLQGVARRMGIRHEA